MLDGIDGGNTGVMVLHDGRIRGGDAFFDYIGAYTSANGRWKGELVNHEHTPSQGERPVFGGYEVGIGFSGTYTDEGAVAEATALAGKRSIRFSAVLRKLARSLNPPAHRDQRAGDGAGGIAGEKQDHLGQLLGVTHFAKSAFGMLARLAAVSMVEGSTALTVILPFHSAASASVRRCTPAFDAA